jgi:hypothetical protein
LTVFARAAGHGGRNRKSPSGDAARALPFGRVAVRVAYFFFNSVEASFAA